MEQKGKKAGWGGGGCWGGVHNMDKERRHAEAQRQQLSVDGTHQLHRTIMFPAEVSTPASQVLWGRAAKEQ